MSGDDGGGMSELASWVALDGCFNFRDLGGYRTRDGRQLRSGRVFRSDGLQRLSAADMMIESEETVNWLSLLGLLPSTSREATYRSL
jgi:hypothetical protein